MDNRISFHVRLLIIVTLAWLLFWLAGLPDYYQQYSDTTMFVFDIVVLPPIWFFVYRSISRAQPGREIGESLWWSFHICIPLFFYDILYCGWYLGYGIRFLWEFWYLTVYYVLPWLIFPLTGLWVARRRKLTT